VTNLKSASDVKSDAVDFMKELVYGGNFDRPRLEPDAGGFYRYKDGKIRIEVAISPRDGWLNCSATVHLLRRRWPFTRLELVLSAGFGYDVTVFRPGLWCNYLNELAGRARAAQCKRDEENQRQQLADNVKTDPDFSPIDDSSIFKK
jgi:hypothetical protein